MAANKKVDLEIHFKPVGNGRKITSDLHENVTDWFWILDGYFLQVEVGRSVLNIPTENIHHITAIESSIVRPVND